MNSIIKEDIQFVVDGFPQLQRFRNKTILISGANGFLPAYMVETLLYLNEQDTHFNVTVLAMVRNKLKAEKRFNHWKGNDKLQLIEHDVCDAYQTEQPIDFIVHAASQASPKYYGTDPVGTLNANVLGTINLIRLAHQKKVESFLFFSSSEIYGEQADQNLSIAENNYGYLDPTKVRSCYAESKRMGENICISWYHQYGVKSKIVRPFHTYGPGMALDDGRVFADFVADAVNKRDIILNSDGSARRAFCYLADATKAFFLILLSGAEGEAYNVGNPLEEFSILELANKVISVRSDLKLKVITNFDTTVTRQYLRSSVSRSIPDISKMKTIGWEPQTSADRGFSRTIFSFIN